MCVAEGCSDITEVEFGVTSAIPSKIRDGPPFGPGDRITFNCLKGIQFL